MEFHEKLRLVLLAVQTTVQIILLWLIIIVLQFLAKVLNCGLSISITQDMKTNKQKSPQVLKGQHSIKSIIFTS